MTAVQQCCIDADTSQQLQQLVPKVHRRQLLRKKDHWDLLQAHCRCISKCVSTSTAAAAAITLRYRWIQFEPLFWPLSICLNFFTIGSTTTAATTAIIIDLISTAAVAVAVHIVHDLN